MKLSDKISTVYPNSEWVLDGADYDDLTFLDATKKLELNEFESKIQEHIEYQAQAQAEKAAEKAALLAKLGITAEQAKLLLS